MNSLEINDHYLPNLDQTVSEVAKVVILAHREMIIITAAINGDIIK